MSRYIDADKLYERMQDICTCYEEGVEVKEEALSMVYDFPTADVEEVKHGKWISQPSMDDRYSRYYICSVCGRLEQVSHAYDIKTFSPYCHCGAKMDKEEEE